jgi:hypothetical protein
LINVLVGKESAFDHVNGKGAILSEIHYYYYYYYYCFPAT